jgi:hypothetical protein
VSSSYSSSEMTYAAPMPSHHMKRAAYAAGYLDALRKFAGLDLEFDSAQEMATHKARRNAVGNVAGLAGSIAGGGAGMAAGGPLGAIAGSMAGQLAKVPGQTYMDVIHDIPQRTKATYNRSLGRQEAAGGFGYRVAAVHELLGDAPAAFAAFAAEDKTPSIAAPVPEQDAEDPRLMPPGWGPVSTLEATNSGSHSMPSMVGGGGSV